MMAQSAFAALSTRRTAVGRVDRNGERYIRATVVTVPDVVIVLFRTTLSPIVSVTAPTPRW